jgi:hypothetical protein
MFAQVMSVAEIAVLEMAEIDWKSEPPPSE